MLPYGVGADSISARAIWGNAKPHGRTLCAPTMHFFDSLRLPSRGAQRCVHPLAPLCEGAPPAGGGGESCTAVRNISGYGKVLSLRPFGAPLPFWRFAPPPPYRGSLSRRGRLFDTLGSPSYRWRPPKAPLKGSHYIGGSPQRLPLRGAPAQRVRGGRDATNFPPTTHLTPP